MMSPTEMAKKAINILDMKKAIDIKLLKTTDITVIADYFVIATASSTTQIKMLADELEKNFKELGEPPLRTEGYRGGGWVLVDFGCLIVHLFLKDVRAFYSLERLWGDAEEVDISEIIAQ